MKKEINNIKLPWIKNGYELFAKEGPKALKVEVIAKRVNKSKSSFYHHFADLEYFTELLLEYHLERSKIIAKKESACKNVVPELFEVMMEFKQDLLFNRQLRIHRDNPQFKACFEKVNYEVGSAIAGIWAEGLGLEYNSMLAQLVLKLTMENFFLQITEETMTYEWLVDFWNELKSMVRAFQNIEKQESIS